MGSKTQRSAIARDPATDTTMRAVVQTGYGTVDVLLPGQAPRPRIAENEVLIQVRAAGLDRGTWHMMTGTPYLMRIIGFGFRRPKNAVPGFDVAGTVVEIGAAVESFAIGDEVFGIARGSFAEYAPALESKLASCPGQGTAQEHAVLAISGITALQALDAGRIQAGQRVLITGASGGVGSYAVQLATASGAEVTAVCSSGKVDLVRSLGADRVIDYTEQDFTTETGRYDLIIDIAGNTTLSRVRHALSPTGTLVIVGSEQGGKLTGMGRTFLAVALSPFVKQRLLMLGSKERGSDIKRMADVIDSGAVTPALDRTFPLGQVQDAMRYLEAGKVRGKIAISI